MYCLRTWRKNPFGKRYQANDDYWAYVLVQYDDETSSYTYGFTFKDSDGYGLYPKTIKKIKSNGSQIKQGLELFRPQTGLVKSITPLPNWENSDFNVNNTTKLWVLEAESEGISGNGKDTCTLVQKGDNYDDVEIEKQRNDKSGTLLNDKVTIFGYSGKERMSVESITTLNYIAIPENAIDSWDASDQKDESIMGWITDVDNDLKIEVYLAQENGVIAPEDSSYLFGGFSSLERIDLQYFNTSKVTNMYQMFENCSLLIRLNLSDFDTSSVQYMHYMFAGCSSLTSLNISNFDTSKVTNMRNMFSECTSLTSLDLSNFNTENVTTMYHMFTENPNLTSLNLSSFVTENVTDMEGMFSKCSQLSNLDIRNFTFTNVTKYNGMFTGIKNQIIVRDTVAKEWIKTTFEIPENKISIAS